ncbi:hypothetical protein AB0939_10470 [Streptomyces sp. NPDC006990]|uniref:hypothetical protein n=1 Tax=unclassified Streptomyces TaxID=2593676 RepID=UPI0034520E59
MAFTAFCVLYRQRYLEYAHNRLADARQADAVVRLAFAELADQWDLALRSPHTNAYAWRLLSRRIRDHAHGAADEPGERPGGESPAGHEGHAFLPDHTDDTRVLLQDLGMPLLEATEMMGHTAPRPR